MLLQILAACYSPAGTSEQSVFLNDSVGKFNIFRRTVHMPQHEDRANCGQIMV